MSALQDVLPIEAQMKHDGCGNRAAEHPQGVRRRKRQSRQRRTQGSGPYGCSIDRKADEEKGIQADSMTRPATAERGIRQVDKHQPPFNYAA